MKWPFSSEAWSPGNLLNEFFAWNKRNFVTWWLWIPLLYAIIAGTYGADRRADMYEVARTAPRFVREGVVDDIGIRGRWMELRTAQDTRRISCEAVNPTWRDTDCLPREKFPLKIRVTLVDYHGVWLIISAADIHGKILLKENDQLQSIQRRSSHSAKQTPEKLFSESFLTAFLLGCTFAFFAHRRRKKLHKVTKNVD